MQELYDSGHTKRECQEAFGFSSQTWHAAVKRGALVTRAPGLPLEELLISGVARSRFHIKRRLLATGIKQALCERCGATNWMGRPLSLALHHINGIRNDNRLENLQLLCPNCHSQTENFAGRNRSEQAAA